MNKIEDRFASAIAFCLAYDAQKGQSAFAASAIPEYLPLAKWALTSEDSSEKSAPAPGDGSLKIALVAGGATKIKSYVFESSRLPEIRGASGLLDRINLTDVPSLFGIPDWDDERGNLAKEVRNAFWNRTGKELFDFPECVVYANGGEILAFAPTILAPDLADEIELIYTRETLVAQSVAAYRCLTLEELRNGLDVVRGNEDAEIKDALGCIPEQQSAFGGLVAGLALAKFRRREANRDEGRGLEYRAIPHFETSPFVRRCSSCERRGAVVVASVAGEDRHLCEACARKRAFGQGIKSGNVDAIEWSSPLEWQPEAMTSWSQEFKNVLPGLEKMRPPRDLNEIGEAAEPEGFIGVIYADGNNMSTLLEGLQTPSQYRDFAEGVYDATKTAVFEALKDSLSGLRPSEKYPFEILSIGGDDFFLVVPAHVALHVACDIGSKVEGKLRGTSQFKLDLNYQWEQVQRCKRQGGDVTNIQSKVSLSTGVVIADAHTPVFYLQELAGQLLKTAKRRAKWLKRHHGYCGGTIDFLALKSVTMISGSVEEFRNSALTRLPCCSFARPYTIAEMRAMLESIKHLKAAGFPRTQLYRLRESLQHNWISSTVDYLYFLSRDKETRQARKLIEYLWTPDDKPRSETTPTLGVNGLAIHPNLLHPWRQRRHEAEKTNSDAEAQTRSILETIWYDLAELYDFVPEEKSK
jgi:CRISPR-associated protein Cmr2